MKDYITRTFELQPLNGRKSFYGKARVIEWWSGKKQLLSYDTIVCEITSDGQFIKTWDGNTQTTNCHIKSFKLFYGIQE